MDSTKLTKAVDYCHAVAVSTDQPFRQVADFIALLKESPEWTEAEIIEVQTHVIRALMHRLGATEYCSDWEVRPLEE